MADVFKLQRQNVVQALTFILIDAADHISGLEGAAPTVTLSKNGGANTAAAGGVAEVGNGLYTVAPNAADASVLGSLVLNASAAGADPCVVQYQVVDYNPLNYTITNTAGLLPNAITLRRLVTMAYQRLGVVASGASIDAALMVDGAQIANDLIDSFQNEALMRFYRTRTTWPMVSRQAVYTIGPGGDVNIPRPVAVDTIAFSDVSQNPVLEYGLSYLTDQLFQGLSQVDLPLPWPWGVYYNPTTPLGTLQFVGVPQSSTLQGVIYVPDTMSTMASLDTLVVAPPGWNRMLRDTLAVELSPSFPEFEVSPTLIALARQAKADIKRANFRYTDLTMPAWGYYDINADSTVFRS